MMAAAYSSLSLEFECVICSDQLKRPKIIGPCNHTFCKDCINEYWVTLGSRMTIPCPECREECPIPSNGGDGLKDHFKISNIMEIYQKQQRSIANRSEVECIMCPNRPHSICKECDLEFCLGCKEHHDRDPQKRDHDFFGLCPSHGNGSFFFCTPCRQAVCSRCRVFDHSQGAHDVTPVCPVVDALMSTIHVSSSELADTVEDEERKLAQLHCNMKQKLNISEMCQHVRSRDLRKREMQTKLQQGWAAVSARITIDTESIASLTNISQELVDLVKATRGNVINTGIGKVKRAIRLFRQLKKVSDISFSADHPCKRVDRLAYLPDGRLASLGRSQSSWDADMIYIHSLVSSKLTSTVGDIIHLARDMAVLSTGELVVARREKPPIRVLDTNTSAYRDITVIYEGDVVEEMLYIETDTSGNMFVVAPRLGRLLVLNPEGNIIQSAQLECHVYGIAYCAINTIIYIATVDRIIRFYWKDNDLSPISSSLIHGVNGFLCRGVCIGCDGEVVVAGKMVSDNNIVIYQVTEGEDKKDLVWREIIYQDGVKRRGTRSVRYDPCICMKNDNLWLAYGANVEKFRLLQDERQENNKCAIM